MHVAMHVVMHVAMHVSMHVVMLIAMAVSYTSGSPAGQHAVRPAMPWKSRHERTGTAHTVAIAPPLAPAGGPAAKRPSAPAGGPSHAGGGRQGACFDAARGRTRNNEGFEALDAVVGQCSETREDHMTRHGGTSG